MNGSQTAITTSPTGGGASPVPVAVDSSCRVPLLVLFLCAAVWLLAGSAFGLIASIKFHSPAFLADSAWLTYGRLRAFCVCATLYGFALQSGLGLALWLFARLGKSPLQGSVLAVIGAVFLNLGIAVGLGGILAGDSTGFENLEMPGYAAPLLLTGYLLVSCPGLLTFHLRRLRALHPAQWFLLVALLWFPWIYCTAELLLIGFPVRGMAQAVIAWWFSQNFIDVWLGLAGLGAAFYFVSALSRQPLKSHYLSLFAFWILVLFGSWAAIPANAPVPAWMPALSTAARGMCLLLVLAVALNIYGTLGRFALFWPSDALLSYFVFGIGSLCLAGLMSAGTAFWEPTRFLHFTWFSPARSQLQVYGFFVITALGGIYYVLPRLLGNEFPWPRLIRLHFWFAAAGVALTAVPLAVGGILQAVKMQDAAIPFVDVAKSTLMFLRVSTVGDLLLVAGHLLLLVNSGALLVRALRDRLVRTYEVATEDLFKGAEAKG